MKIYSKATGQMITINKSAKTNRNLKLKHTMSFIFASKMKYLV